MLRSYNRKDLNRKCSLSPTEHQFRESDSCVSFFLFLASWTAICRGAVIHGLTVEKADSRFAVEVRSRIARKTHLGTVLAVIHLGPRLTHMHSDASYGIVCLEKWDKSKHLQEDKKFDKQDRKWKANNQMKWLVVEASTIWMSPSFLDPMLIYLSGRGPNGELEGPPQLFQAA